MPQTDIVVELDRFMDGYVLPMATIQRARDEIVALREALDTAQTEWREACEALAAAIRDQGDPTPNAT